MVKCSTRLRGQFTANLTVVLTRLLPVSRRSFIGFGLRKQFLRSFATAPNVRNMQRLLWSKEIGSTVLQSIPFRSSLSSSSNSSNNSNQDSSTRTNNSSSNCHFHSHCRNSNPSNLNYSKSHQTPRHYSYNASSSNKQQWSALPPLPPPPHKWTFPLTLQ